MNQRVRVLQELGEQFEHAVTRASRRHSGWRGRTASTWRAAAARLRVGFTAVPVLLGAAAAIAVAAIALSVAGHRHGLPASAPSPGGPPAYVSPTDPALKYLRAARVINPADAGCRGPRFGQVTSQTVSRAAPTELLPILSVLRRPKRPSDRLPPLVAHRKPWPLVAQVVYVNYIRLARTQDGARYYLIPIVGAQGSGVSAACAAAWRAALHRELPHIPASLRAHAVQVLGDAIALQRYQSEPHQEIWFFALDPGGGGGGGGGGATASEISEGRGYLGTSQVNSRSPTFLSGDVPDGVDTMTLRFRTRIATPLTITTRPVNNVFALRVPLRASNGFPQTVVWRKADGTVIKTIKYPR